MHHAHNCFLCTNHHALYQKGLFPHIHYLQTVCSTSMAILLLPILLYLYTMSYDTASLEVCIQSTGYPAHPFLWIHFAYSLDPLQIHLYSQINHSCMHSQINHSWMKICSA